MKENNIIVETQMLIRKPGSLVFDAFINPEITRNFWFTKGTAKLEAGKNVTWEWEMYGVKADVSIKEMILNKNL